MTDGARQQSPADDGSPEAIAAYPELSDAQLARLRAYGSPEELEVGEAAFAAGDPTYDLIVIEQGAIEVVRAATVNAPEASVITHRRGAFVGELSLLTGQTTYLTARVVERARVHRISPPQLRRLMAQDPELSDLLLGAFLARRRRISAGPAARVLQIIGSELDSEAMALRTYAARRGLPHVWLDADSLEGGSLTPPTARSRSPSAAPTSPPGCRATSSTGSWPIAASRFAPRPRFTRLEGEHGLERITVTHRPTGHEETRTCRGLFCFIGAEPATGWLTRVAVDHNGFVLTDVQLTPDDLDGTWAALGRSPLPFETNVPAVFAAGDVRHGSMKRVAAAAGEGASAVSSVHRAIGVLS
jgi:CRP-like cAMP-binding protein